MAKKQKKETAKKDTKAVGKKSGNDKPRLSLRFRLFKYLFYIGALLVLVPTVLLLIYKIPFVRPISAHMLKEGIIGNGMQREWVAMEDIAPVAYQTVLVSEDGKFCAHNGIDWEALNTVIEDAIDGEKTRGASTITMQLAKNLFLWNGRSFVRKGLEVPLAMLTDAILSKRRIMEIYLNIAEWDKGIFGIELAAQTYFNRSAAKLGPRYSSLLAVTLPNPQNRNAAKPSRSMNRVANIVQKRARASGAYVKCLEDGG